MVNKSYIYFDDKEIKITKEFVELLKSRTSCYEYDFLRLLRIDFRFAALFRGKRVGLINDSGSLKFICDSLDDFCICYDFNKELQGDLMVYHISSTSQSKCDSNIYKTYEEAFLEVIENGMESSFVLR